MTRENHYIGKQLGNYRILEELASGSFGRVYRGVHVFLTSDLKRYQEALEAYERSIQLDSSSAVAYSGKGDALYCLKRYQEALLAYERAIQLHPNFAAAQNGKSWTLWQLGL